MTQKTSAVVVTAADWTGSLEDLARKMMPVVRLPPNHIVPLLARGPMTIEADLTRGEAEKLRARLLALGVPAHISPPSDSDALLPQFQSLNKSDKPDKLDKLDKLDKPDKSDRFQKMHAEIPAPNLKTTLKKNLLKKQSPELPRKLPNLPLPPPKLSAPETPSIAEKTPSIDELSIDEPSIDEFGPLDDLDIFYGLEEILDDKTFAPTAQPSTASADEHISRPAPQLKPAPPLKPGPQLNQSNFGAEPAPRAHSHEPTDDQNTPTIAQDRPEIEKKIPNPAATQPKTSTHKPAIHKTAAHIDFDAQRIDQALEEHARQKPPYEPEGFDDRVEHVPAFAAVLSFLAPGAGQIYNGQPEKVRDLCVQAALVRPWWESVRQAHDYARQIRSYWAPRPEKGALKRALSHLAVCWVVGLIALSAMVWAGSAIYRLALKPDAPTISETELPRAIADARRARQGAAAAGLKAADAHADTKEPARQFTMSDEERAERLFRRAYTYCEGDEFAACATAMKRVTSLSPKLRRKAFLLQAWASLRYSGESTEPMPDVGPVESLAAYEFELLQQEAAP